MGQFWVEINTHGPIALNGEAYTAVQRMFYAVGFTRMPVTWAELERGYFFASQLASTKNARFLPDYEGWCKAARGVFEKYNLRHLALYDAAMAEDEVEMKKLHKETDWLAQMATEYDERYDELMPPQKPTDK